MSPFQTLDASALLGRVAQQIPPALHANIVVIGSIAAAWAFRDVSDTDSVATKDIDLLLRSTLDAVATAQTLGAELLDHAWQPRLMRGREPGTPFTHDDDLPALRLSPPDERDGWFVELLAEPPPTQTGRKLWRRFRTRVGDFGLPSFRYLPVAVHGADETPFGLRVARPARMALAHLLEHADPDRTPISTLPNRPPRFVKDVGRAVSLWWLARQQSSMADGAWLSEWRETLTSLHSGDSAAMKQRVREGAAALADDLREAHAIALNGLLAPHGTTLDAFARSHASLASLIERL